MMAPPLPGGGKLAAAQGTFRCEEAGGASRNSSSSSIQKQAYQKVGAQASNVTTSHNREIERDELESKMLFLVLVPGYHESIVLHKAVCFDITHEKKRRGR